MMLDNKASICFLTRVVDLTVTYKAENQKKFTGSKIGAIFRKITSQVTTKSLKIGHRAL